MALLICFILFLLLNFGSASLSFNNDTDQTIMSNTSSLAAFNGSYPPKDDVNSSEMDLGSEKKFSCDMANYIVSVRRRWRAPIFGLHHICGGVPISSYLVISSATCFLRTSRRIVRPRQVIVSVGCKNRLEESLSTFDLAVKEIYLQKFRLSRPENDIAVLILKDAIPTLTLIPIATLAADLPRVGSECIAMGWGRLFLHGPLVDELTVTNYTVIDRSMCVSYYPYLNGQEFICTLADPHNDRRLCNEDAGGPLMCDGLLYGIISGFTDCFEDRIHFFIPTALHYKWIVMLSVHDDSKLIFSLIILFGLFCVLMLINKHRLC